MSSDLIPADVRARLKAFRLQARRISGSQGIGQPQSRSPGARLEFPQRRPCEPGGQHPPHRGGAAQLHPAAALCWPRAFETGGNLPIRGGTLKGGDPGVRFSSAPIPGWPFGVRTNLPKDLQEKLRKGIMDLKGARFGKLGVITAMDPATDADYNVIRDLVAFQDKMKAAARK